MTYRRLAGNLPQILRGAGLKVAESPGWRTRGRPASTGGFDPVGILAHHTATTKASSDDNVVRLLVNGRSDLPGPLCQIGLARDGTVWMIAAGRANHAGKAKASGAVAAGDGNRLYIGIEAFNDGRGEPWPKKQYDAYVTLAAVLCREVTGNSAQTVRGHKETSVTGKVDPTFNMNTFRADVSARIRNATATATTDWFDMASKKELREVIRAELADLPKDVWKYPIPATDGAPAQKVLRQASNSLQVSKRVRDIVRKRFNATDDQLDALMDELAALADQEDN